MKKILVLLFLLVPALAWGAGEVSSLTALGGAPATGDLIEMVDINDTTYSANGTNKKMTVSNLFTSPTLSSPTINTPAITMAEVDGKAHGTLSAANVSNTVIYNTGMADSADVHLHLPAAAAGYSFLATVGTARAYHWGVQAAAGNKIYLVAAAGTVVGGDDAAAVVMVAAQVGQSFACWTFKTDDYDWMCKAVSIGTSTFEAHAAFPD